MKGPEAMGRTLEALEPLIHKLNELEDRALRGASMSVVEMGAQLATTATTVARHAMELILEQAARAEKGPVSCPHCGGEGASKGFENTFFVGRFGRVTVSRRRLTCRCKHSWFAMDRAWGVPTNAYADDVREAADRLSCRLGFEEAVAELRYLWGVAPDASTAKRWVGQDGARAEAAARTDASEHWKQYETNAHAVERGDQRPIERTEGFGVIEVDGVHALTWKPGQEPRRRSKETGGTLTASSATAPSAASENSERTTRHQAPSTLSEVPGSPMGPTGRSPRVHGREVCMGLAYRGEHACEQSPGRGVLLQKRYVATLNDRDGFWTKLHAAAALQGALRCKALVRVSDGSTYFIDRSRELFCDQPLVGVLDIQHAKQHVWEAGHKVAADPKKTPAWVLPLTDLIAKGRVDEVVTHLAEERKRRRGHRKRKAIESLAGYLSRHKDLMDYPRYKKAGYPIASAAIESTNKRLVGRRCKQGGMIWSEPGLESIVALRLAFYNPGAWHHLWPHVPPVTV